MMRPLPLLAAGLMLSACSSSKDAATVTTAPTLTQPPAPTVAACPTVTKPRFTWPVEVPADLPQPPAAALGPVTRNNGLTLVRFSTQTSLQQAVLFVVNEVQKAGFTLGRGDAEPAEADAPFGRGDIRGIYKMVARTGCTTDWLVAVTKTRIGVGSPILPTASRGPSSQPLPFG